MEARDLLVLVLMTLMRFGIPLLLVVGFVAAFRRLKPAQS